MNPEFIGQWHVGPGGELEEDYLCGCTDGEHRWFTARFNLDGVELSITPNDTNVDIAHYINALEAKAKLADSAWRQVKVGNLMDEEEATDWLQDYFVADHRVQQTHNDLTPFE